MRGTIIDDIGSTQSAMDNAVDSWGSMVFEDTDLSFNVLGPLEVYVQGRLVPVGSPKHRALLAALLLKAGSPVSNKDLAIAVWGCDQPEVPRRAVQLLVSRLRTLLGGAAIVTCADGYLMEVRPERLDLGRFRYWLEQADMAAKRSDLKMEATALTEALAQWRDEPLTDIPSGSLEQQVNRLVEQRLRTLERRFDVDLLLGHHRDLVDALMEATARHPLRERFWAQLMTALHRSGRRAEALEAYHTGRRHLVEELGIEPGEEMRRLQVTVLGHRPAEPEAPAMALAVPRQLPSQIPVLVGRRREVDELDRLTMGEERDLGTIVLINGTAGVGKTALALHWSRHAIDLFPDGQLWADLRGYHHRSTRKPEQVLTSFLRALRVPEQEIPPDLESQSALYRSLMDGRRALVVLDNARTAEQVRPLLPGNACNTVLVTSRSRLTGLVAADCAQVIVLDVFSRQDSGEMLITRLGADRVGAEPAAARRIVERCAQLPLALAITAARVIQQPHQTLAAVAERLQATRETLDEFTDPDAAVDVRAVFSWSYRTLSESAARLFRLMGVHPGTQMTAAAVAGLAAVPLDELRPLLNELTGAHLVTESATGRYGLHTLLHVYAAELAWTHDGSEERKAALRRALDHYLQTADAAAKLIDPVRDSIHLTTPGAAWIPSPPQDRNQALAWLTTEHTNLMTAIERACGNGFDTHAWQLVQALADFQQRQGLWEDRATALQAALEATRRLGDSAEQARAHCGLGHAYSELDRDGDAHPHLLRALDLYTTLTEPAGQAHAHLGLARVLEQKGDLPSAREQARRALDLCQQVRGDQSQYARTIGVIARYEAQLGNHQDALEQCQKALAIVQRLGDRLAEGTAWDDLGYVHHRLANHHHAIACYHSALRIHRDLGHRYSEAKTLSRLGDTLRALGDDNAAEWTATGSRAGQIGKPKASRTVGRQLSDRENHQTIWAEFTSDHKVFSG